MAGEQFDHGQEVYDAVDPEGSAAASFAVTASAAQSGVLTEGIYDVWCGADCYLRVAPDASGVTTGNGYLLRANNTIPIFVRSGSQFGVVCSAGGTFTYHKVG